MGGQVRLKTREYYSLVFYKMVFKFRILKSNIALLYYFAFFTPGKKPYLFTNG